MKIRGNWLNGDSHGNTKPIVAALRLMNKVSKGKPVKIEKTRQSLPQFFEGDALSFEGQYFLEKSKVLLPIIFN